MNEQEPMIPLWQSEKVIMHQNFANRRMLIALITVCVTFLITITIFVVGYTEREKNWLNTITRITPVAEVQDGSQQKPDH